MGLKTNYFDYENKLLRCQSNVLRYQWNDEHFDPLFAKKRSK